MKKVTGYRLQVTGLIIFTFYFLLFTFPAYAACHPGEPCPAGLQEIDKVFSNVISVIVGLGFIASLVMLVWAGIKYLTSGGEPKAVQAAHLTVTWALLGILFLAIAWLILQLVQAVTGVQVTFFDIRALCEPNGDWCK